MSCTGEKKKQSEVLAQASKIAGSQVSGAAVCMYPGCNQPLDAQQECPRGHSQCPTDVARALLAPALRWRAGDDDGRYSWASMHHWAALAREVAAEQGDAELAVEAERIAGWAERCVASPDIPLDTAKGPQRGRPIATARLGVPCHRLAAGQVGAVARCYRDDCRAPIARGTGKCVRGHPQGEEQPAPDAAMPTVETLGRMLAQQLGLDDLRISVVDDLSRGAETIVFALPTSALTAAQQQQVIDQLEPTLRQLGQPGYWRVREGRLVVEGVSRGATKVLYQELAAQEARAQNAAAGYVQPLRKQMERAGSLRQISDSALFRHIQTAYWHLSTAEYAHLWRFLVDEAGICPDCHRPLTKEKLCSHGHIVSTPHAPQPLY